MKKRAEIAAERWTTSDGRIDFFRRGDQVATIRGKDEYLAVDLPGIESPMKVRKITLLQDLDWLLLDFEEASVLHRIAVRFGAENYDELNAGLLSLLKDRATPYFRRNRPESNEDAQSGPRE